MKEDDDAQDMIYDPVHRLVALDCFYIPEFLFCTGICLCSVCFALNCLVQGILFFQVMI